MFGGRFADETEPIRLVDSQKTSTQVYQEKAFSTEGNLKKKTVGVLWLIGAGAYISLGHQDCKQKLKMSLFRALLVINTNNKLLFCRL